MCVHVRMCIFREARCSLPCSNNHFLILQYFQKEVHDVVHAFIQRIVFDKMLETLAKRRAFCVSPYPLVFPCHNQTCLSSFAAFGYNDNNNSDNSSFFGFFYHLLTVRFPSLCIVFSGTSKEKRVSRAFYKDNYFVIQIESSL